MIGIGLIGTGLHGSRYASHLAKGDVPGLKLVAVTRRDRLLGDAKARELGCRFVPTTEELVHDREVGAVVVVSPASHHPEAISAAVRAHKPVLCEKPLCHSLEEARALEKNLGGRGKVTVAQTLRWEPTYRRATDLARDLGPVRHAQALFLKGDFTSRSTSDSRASDFHRAVYACGIHHLDWAGTLFPEGFVRAYATEVPGDQGLSFSALLDARSGGTFALTVRLTGEGTADAFSVLGERGALVGDRPEHVLARLAGAGRSPVDLGPRVATLPLVLASFRDYVLGTAPNPVPLAAAARAVARADACVRSLALRAPVAVEGDSP